jgi:neutral ceramidase
MIRSTILRASAVYLALTATAAIAADLRVGMAVEDITPPVGMRVGGNYVSPISTGVHDPLVAKAIVFEQGGVKAALVICDLTGISLELSTLARKLASEATGIPTSQIIVSATHTHGAPQYAGPIRDLEHANELAAKGSDRHEPVDYTATTASGCARAITKANASLKPASVEVGAVDQPGLAFNRRFHMKNGYVRFNPGKKNPEIVRVAGPVDIELPILVVRDAVGGKPLGSFVAFAMHVATFGGPEWGADFPAHLETGLRKEFGPEFISIFGEGTAGDINHIDVSSDAPQSSATEPGRIGAALSATVLKAIPDLKPVEAASLAVRSTVVKLPLQEVTDEQVARAVDVFYRKVSPTPDFYLLVESHRILETRDRRKQFGDAEPAEVQAIRIGADTAIVSLPHEVFVELGTAIKKASPFKHTFVLSLAEDADFYVPTRKAFAEGSYEVVTCPLKPGCGELLVDTAVRLLKDLKP